MRQIVGELDIELHQTDEVRRQSREEHLDSRISRRNRRCHRSTGKRRGGGRLSGLGRVGQPADAGGIDNERFVRLYGVLRRDELKISVKREE